MNLLLFFQARSKWFYIGIGLLGAINSLSNIVLLMLINNVLGGKYVLAGQYTWLAFLVLTGISFAANRYFQNYMVGLTNNIMFDLELSIIQKVRNASFESFERLGSEKIYAAISDARLLSRIPQVVVMLLNSAITVICALVYLFWISFIGGVIVFLLMATLLIVYMIRDRNISKDLNIVRDLQDSYYDSLRELMVGFKQIRISALRNDNLFNRYLFQNRNKAKGLSVKTAKKYVGNELLGTYSWYIVLGIVIFVLPAVFGITLAQTAVFIATVLFMIGPVSQLVMFFPFYTASKISLERMQQIDSQLKVDAVPVPKSHAVEEEINSIRFEDIYYSYQDGESNTFHLELPEMTLSKGELIFVTGGNGSGKTTFINILTGLCKPVRGKLFINEEEIPWEKFCTYSNNMAVVYTNHHLFSENYDDHDLSDDNEQLAQLRSMINLEGIMKRVSEKNWVDTGLSRGQQKRLSLLLALLEDKPLLILDEWAAEQDPYNRRLFYTEWLAAIKAMGKTIIAITHDDDYYHLADRVIKFNYGKVVSDHAEITSTTP